MCTASKNESALAMTSSAKTLQQSIVARDAEILRLQRLLDGGRPEASVDAQAREDSMQKMVRSFNHNL